jgi:hypothetical protein
MPDKIVYDVIQGFEVENGVPHLISTNIQVIESGSDLFSFAQEWLIKNTKLASFNKQQYIEYKPSKKAKRYDLVLASRVTSLQLSFPIEKIKDPKQKMELESQISPDPVFPYLHRNSK